MREQLRRAELLLSVPMQNVGWLDFRQARRIAEMGRGAARDELPRILAGLETTRAHPITTETR